MPVFEMFIILIATMSSVVIAYIERGKTPDRLLDRCDEMQRKYEDMLTRLVKSETRWNQYLNPGELESRLGDHAQRLKQLEGKKTDDK